MIRCLRNILISGYISLSSSFTFADDFTVAVLAHSGYETAYSQWQGTLDYLQQQIPQHHFSLLPVTSINEMERIVSTGDIDFIITQPVAYVDLERKYESTRMLTLVKQNGITEFGSAIITARNNLSIRQLEDIKGKTIGGINKNGFGGWLIGYDELLKNGIDAYKDTEDVVFLGSQVSVVKAVVNNEIDVGIVRTGIIENMVKRGEINPNQILVINKHSNCELSEIHSTEHYPEWAFAKTKGTPRKISEQIATVLLNMPSNNVAAIRGGYQGWTIPLSYKPIHDFMKEHKIGSYFNIGKMGYIDFISQYKYELSLFSLIFIGLTISICILRKSINQLKYQTILKENAFKEMSYLANHDFLTGLPNRHLVIDLLTKALHRAKRDKTKLALMFIDLDGFKIINDKLGHAMGDKVLCEVANIIDENTRECDIIGRFGGDEFVVSITDFDDVDGIAEVANKLKTAISNNKALRDEQQKIQASIGVVISSEENNSPELLINAADRLMYRAKSEGKDRYILEEYVALATT